MMYVWWFSSHLVLMSGRLHRRGVTIYTLVLPSVVFDFCVNICVVYSLSGRLHRRGVIINTLILPSLNRIFFLLLFSVLFITCRGDSQGSRKS